MSIYEMIHKLNTTCNTCTYGKCENCRMRKSVEKASTNPKYEAELKDPNLKKWLEKNLELG